LSVVVVVVVMLSVVVVCCYVQVLKRCQHLLMSPDARLRLAVLDTISQCCLAMKSHYGMSSLFLFAYQCGSRELLAVWLSGNALASINVVALRQTRLVPG